MVYANQRLFSGFLFFKNIEEVALLTELKGEWEQIRIILAQELRQGVKHLGLRGKDFNDSELEEKATIRKFRIVQTEGSRQVEREINHYNLQMIIAVGFLQKFRIRCILLYMGIRQQN